ncbi:serine protease [Nonomuraea sp. NBC_01738]|uniref:serine protease n=1 Tax=Nonomuraea sp. NBC_01738 TaxID=2976003 RepID=UPI002E1655A0|nr:serine protease [Nonomuraea sp. NBC_01738]
MDAQAHAEAAAERYEGARSGRALTERRREQTGQHIVDAPDQVLARAGRLIQQGRVPAAVVERLREQSPDTLLERIIGLSADFQPANFLTRGARAITSVARVALGSNGRAVPIGTGFLIAPSILLTNNHVLPEPETAAEAQVEFGAEMSVDDQPPVWTRFTLDPDDLFVTDVPLDYTFVRVRPAADGRLAGALYGWSRLIGAQGKITIGESVNLVGHPAGRLKEITIRRSELVDQLPSHLHYSGDTEQGSSGSPVFNDQWEVVALHHSGVPGPDGAWVANEGVRVSSIVASLPPDLAAELGTTPRESLPAPRRTGAAARPEAFGGTRHLILIHGRGQAGRDPEAMRREWIAGLNKGLTLAAIPAITPGDACLPFYGDRLTGALESLSPTAQALYDRLLTEAASVSGREGLVSGLQGALSWLAATTGLDRVLIAAIFHDVAAYLDAPAVRQAVLDTVTETLPTSGQAVIVSHSLGTVVAMDLMTRLPGNLEVPLLITLGSPLGLDTVQTRLLTGGPIRPDRAGRWLNVWSPADPVSIGCPCADDWKGQLDERAVDNPLGRAHDVAEYLGHPEIAAAIHQALS